MNDLLHVDLFAGTGGWGQHTRDSDRWRYVGVDVEPMDGADVLADVRQVPLDCRPDLLTASPPCTEFARWGLPWIDAGEPSLELVEAALTAVDDLEPRWWVLENSRFLAMYWRDSRTNVGPFHLWGEWPPVDLNLQVNGKMETSGQYPEKRAAIPEPLARSIGRSVEIATATATV